MTLKVKTKNNCKVKFLNHSKPITAVILTISVVLAFIVLFTISNLKDEEFQAFPDFKIDNGVLEKYYGANEKVIIPNGVKIIAKYAFEGCKAMTSITIPDSVKEIHEDAFNLTNLKKVHIPKSITYIDKNAFQYNDNLEMVVDSKNKKYSSKDGVLYNKDMTELIRYYDKEGLCYFRIPDGVEKIGDCAFFDCKLVKLYLPSSVKEIGDCAFSGYYGISDIEVDSENKNYIVKDNILFSKDMKELVWYSRENTKDFYSIPDGVTVINAGAFFACRSLNNITIPNTMKIIEDKAFMGMLFLESLTIPDSVSKIGEAVFFCCNNLNSVNVGKNNKYFTSNNGILFDKDMTEIIVCPTGYPVADYKIPDGVKKIRDYAFYNCIRLENITVPESVTYIGKYAFYECARLLSINLPSKITSIAEYTFVSCSQLVKITVPDKVKYIEDRAFENCSSLVEVKFPSSLNKIGKEAFACCSSLETVDIPQNVTEIADNAFDYCLSLKGINVAAKNKMYSSKAGVLFNDELTKLIKYPGGKTDSHYEVPKGVKKIIGNSFSDCKFLISSNVPNSVEIINGNAFSSNDSNIAYINVEGDNKNYTSKNGVLFDKSMKELILYPYGKKDKEYSIPEGVTTIRENAFLYWADLLQLTIPKSVTNIEKSGLPYRNEQFSIKGHEYSAAHEYAATNFILFVSEQKQ